MLDVCVCLGNCDIELYVKMRNQCFSRVTCCRCRWETVKERFVHAGEINRPCHVLFRVRSHLMARVINSIGVMSQVAR
jgi:hypothetical protein